MYKLLIVDDEETIAEGLRNIVDWKALGFEVAQIFSDGREVIEYLQNHEADVILTDIKMTFVSGLELAKFVLQNKLPTKVVVMSGYKEFELARQAVAYNVKFYLLKPTGLDDIYSIFQKIREDLDAENRNNEAMKSRQQEFNELIFMYQEQFFTDLIIGAIRSREVVDRRIKARLEIDPEACKICVYRVCFEGQENSGNQRAIKQIFDNTLNNLMAEMNTSIKYFTIFNSFNIMYLIAVAIRDMESEKLEETSLSALKLIMEKITTVIGMGMNITRENTFSDLYGAAEYYKPIVADLNNTEEKLEDIVNPFELSRLNKKKRMLLQYINSNNLEMAQNLFENIMDELKAMHLKVINNFIIDLFFGIKHSLEELGINLKDDLLNYYTLTRFDDVDRIRSWGLSMIGAISKFVEQSKLTLNDSVIEKAKKYITDNSDKEIGLDEVSSHVFLSPIYFSHLFKQKTGENFIDYLNYVRISKAKEWLKSPQYKIAEVSEKVGYGNVKYFYKLFKKYTGFTPATYKANMIKNEVL